MTNLTTRLANAANGIEAGLVVVTFGAAILTGSTVSYIGLFLAFIASQTVLPALRAGGA